MVKFIDMQPVAETKPDYHEIACQQILAEDQSVFSIQWVEIPGTVPPQLTSDWLLQRYLAHIKRCTATIICPAMTENGLELRLGNSRLSLISFNPPLHAVTKESNRTSLSICGGFLVQPRECDRGQLDFLVEQVDDGFRISLQLSDFCPLLLGSKKPARWRKLLYRTTQAYIHKLVTVRFLARVHRQLTGSRPKTRVVKVVLRQGEET